MENRVVINSSILNESPAGLGVYAKNVIQELNRFDNYLVLSPVKIDGVNVEKISKYVSPSYKKIGGFARVLWTQFVLPFKVK